ncbi:MAG: hypothetical protein A2583_06080 [Bdellovibrionales bacterium RIFOXYD1_FULL_53_11]|nr:MAG: hypothetical protein A2583_06080 [Bdellovibrionales bacterium RIFOXYD1_FULL_53_11]
MRNKSFASFLITMLLLSAVPANAVYDRIVTWSDMSSLDLAPVFHSQYGSPANMYEPLIPQSAYGLALRDADGRIGNEFKIPPGMRESVNFWLHIYTEYSTQQVVLFDEQHPEVVYEIMDFRELSKTARNRIVYELLQERRIKKNIKSYREAFRKLAKNPRPKNPGEFEKKILAATGKTRHKHKFSEFSKNLRTQTGQRDNIIKGLLAAEVFFPKMDQIFSSYGIPSELTRLALVESSFNLGAISRAGASGVWQFMRKSAKEYMLVDENRGIDERRSPLKSTVAAAKLLLRNKKILGHWALAITAYNHGASNLKKVPDNMKTHARIGEVFSPCSKKSPLGWASRNYYSEFLAVLYAESYRHLFYGEPPAKSMRSIAFHTVDAPRSAFEIAMSKGIPLHEFHFLNPDILDVRKKLPRKFVIAIPAEADNLAALVKKAPKQASLMKPRNTGG